MNYEILDALSQITREKSVERQNLIETLEAGLVSAGRKKFGPTANIQVVFDNTSGSILLFRVFDVVETVEDPVAQMAADEAQKLDPSLEIGSQLRYPLSIEDFGRNAIQAAKQVFIQRVREAERERIFQEFADKVGSLVRGVVQQVDRGNGIVKLERCEGFLPAREQIPRDHLRQNDYVRAIILNVDKNARGPQVILSRTHPDFLRRLFEAEVPEIAERIVEIKAVAREAGGRSKISVYSHDPRVDAVGSCVGLKGSRVQSIVRELGGERIDIVPWSSDAGIFVSRSLSPAKVLDARVHEADRRTQVVVADDQLSLAIGKGGQNARLAAKLTGWKIDLISKSEDMKRQEAERAMLIPLDQMDGLGPKLREKLLGAGIESVQELAASRMDDLTEIEGVGEKTAEKTLAAAREWLEAHPPQPPAEVEFTPEMEKDDAAAAVAALESAVASAHAVFAPPAEWVEIDDADERPAPSEDGGDGAEDSGASVAVDDEAQPAADDDVAPRGEDDFAPTSDEGGTSETQDEEERA
jgi:N utilization substance protein A